MHLTALAAHAPWASSLCLGTTVSGLKIRGNTMGKGAFVSVTNNRREAVKLFVKGQHCMYDDGAEGSRVSYFNNLTVAAGQTLPNAKGQYVEAKASSTGGDTCGTEASGFDVEVNVETTELGTFAISERWNQYHGETTNDDDLKVNVGRGGDQDTIQLTIT